MAIAIPYRDESDSTVQRCWQVVAAKPRQAEARYALAVALVDACNPAEAVEQSCRALELEAKHYPSARLLASLLQTYALNDDIDVSARAFLAAMEFPDIDRQALCVAAVYHLKTLPLLARVLALGDDEGWDIAARYFLSASCRNLLRNKLFSTVLSLCVNTDTQVEFLLTALRRHLLLSAPREFMRKRHVYEFACVLIQQCINNEYIFAADDDERRALDELEFDFGNIAHGANRGATDFLLMALYRPPHEFIPDNFGTGHLDQLSPRMLRDVVRRYLKTRRTDARLTHGIERLTEIVDETSKQVERQYIADPYPRWLDMQTPEPGSGKLHLHDYFSPSELARLDDPFHVLIAGCGTGRQAVGAALEYGHAASVLAIDLSAPSLAYGQRMASTFNAANLRFAQADILGLDKTERQFDLIECVGVLHHMAKPYEAWRILVDRLRPGGLMLVGLYSAISRAGIMALREDPACPGPDADDDELRAFRSVLMHRRADEAGAELVNSQDFFIKSNFRDLALHVSEQHCSIPEIEDFLAANEMNFHGFRLPESTLETFTAAYPEDGLPGTLDNWWAFEQERARTFDGMYIFWCRKRSKLPS